MIACLYLPHFHTNLFTFGVMNSFLEYLIEPYQSYSIFQIACEIFAAFTGILSVIFATKKHILVYPIGILSTSVYTILLYQWGLLGEMGINAYYTIMSIYGWIQWKEKETEDEYPISKLSISEWQKIYFIFLIVWGAVWVIYFWKYQDIHLIPLINYADVTATACFLCAMYLMAKIKIENWILWLIGNMISIPLFIVKGYGITAVQYILFFFLAIHGWNSWKQKSQEH